LQEVITKSVTRGKTPQGRVMRLRWEKTVGKR